MNYKFACQVDNESYYYSSSYNTINRFCSYYFQIKTILDLVKGNSDYTVLEIGMGNKLVSNFLRGAHVELKTCDFDANLKPDFLADVRSLPLKDRTFDIVAAFEVLEHIPFDDVYKALKEMRRVARRYIVLSLPYSNIFFELLVNIKIPYLLRGIYVIPLIRIPYLKKHEFSPKHNHYWEIGKRGYSLKKIKRIFEDLKLAVINEFRPILNSYHYFVVLKV